MKKTLAIALSLTAMSVLPLSAARADEGWKDGIHSAARFPIKVTGVATGLVVGIPMAITRKASNRMINYTNDFADKIGGHNSAPPCMFASVVGLPFGLLVGTAEGVYVGGTNAFQHGFDKPFSGESLSLSETLEEH